MGSVSLQLNHKICWAALLCASYLFRQANNDLTICQLNKVEDVHSPGVRLSSASPAMAAAMAAAVVGAPDEEAASTTVLVVATVVATTFRPDPTETRSSVPAADAVAVVQEEPNVVGFGPGLGPARPMVIEGRGFQGPTHVGAVAVVGPRVAAVALARRPRQDLPGAEGAAVAPTSSTVGLTEVVGPGAVVARPGPTGIVELLPA